MPILKSVSYSSSNPLDGRNGDYIFDSARSAGPCEGAYSLVAVALVPKKALSFSQSLMTSPSTVLLAALTLSPLSQGSPHVGMLAPLSSIFSTASLLTAKVLRQPLASCSRR